jgi:uncharacterized membrane protein
MPKRKSILAGVIFFVIAVLLISVSGFSPMWFPTQEDQAPRNYGTGPVIHNFLLKQSFRVKKDWLYGIDLILSNVNTYSGIENIILITDTNYNILSSARFPSDIIHFAGYYSFRLNKKTYVGKGNKCNILIYSVNGDEKSSVQLGIFNIVRSNPIYVIPLQNNDIQNSCKTPGQPYPKGMCFRTYESDYESFSFWYIPLYILASALTLVIIFFTRIKVWLTQIKIRPERIYLYLALSAGCILVFLTPPLQVPDENYHLYRAFQLSELNVFQSDKTVPKSLVTLYDTLNRMNFQTIEKTSREEILSLGKVSLDPTNRITIDVPNYFMPYIPQAIGISIGRVFSFSPVMLVYIGRLFNVLLSILIVFYAIRITPVFKWVFFLLGLMPMTVFLFASLSKDGLTISFCFLLIALFLQYAFDNDKKITVRDLVVLFGVSSFMALTRPIYLIILVMYFFIPVHKIGSLRKYLILFLGLLLSAFLFSQIMSIAGMIQKPAKETSVTTGNTASQPTSSLNISLSDLTKPATGADAHAQKNWILHNPGQYLLIVFKSTFIYMRMINLDSFVGIFGWMSRPLPTWLINLYLWVLVFTALIISGDDYKLGPRNRLLIVFIFIGGILLVETGQYLYWTSVGQKFIAGVQGRYYIPYAPAFLLLLYNTFSYRKLTQALILRKKKQPRQKQKGKITPVLERKVEVPVMAGNFSYIILVCFCVISLLCTLYVVLTGYYVT